jgi:glycosyltransferase involved in cell wall biosynthesis
MADDPLPDKPPKKPAKPPGPLVSCVMLTADRPEFAAQAIRDYQAQTYLPRELIILDTGRNPVANLVPPGDDSIRYVRLELRRPPPVGELRNRANDFAIGDYIAHWDDDNRQSPRRLEIQAAALAANPVAQACGLSKFYAFDAEHNLAWEYAYPPGGGAWLYGATLMYRRTAWQATPFAPLSVGEDNAFVRRQPPGSLLALDDYNWFVEQIHAGNTSLKLTHGDCYRRADVDMVKKLMEAA